MNRFISIITLIITLTHVSAYAAKPREVAPSYAWRTMAPLGLHEPATIDTLLYDYPLKSVPSEVSLAWS